MSADLTNWQLGAAFAQLRAVQGARPIALTDVEIGPGVIARLPQLLSAHLATAGGAAANGARRPRVVAVITDGVPMTCAGTDLYGVVVDLLTAIAEVRVIVAPGHDGRLHADDATLSAVAAAATGAAAIVAVGSGTLADISKAVSARLGALPLIVVQTALSVNGYSDDQSVLLVNGVKRTTPSRWPDALIADTDILSEAPPLLNAAGVGDLLAMFTAPADWRLAALLDMGDGYSAELVAAVRDHGPGLLAAAAGLKDGERSAIEYLASMLTLSGMSMGAAGTTAPSSGAEHTISHLIEMVSVQQGVASAFHGAQVGACTILAALAWQRVRAALGSGHATLVFPTEEEMSAQVHTAFASLDASGAMGEECWRLYRRKLARWSAKRNWLEQLDWTFVLDEVAPLLADPRALVDALAQAGAPTRFAELAPAPAAPTVRWALANCHLMRDRFSVIDLAFFLGRWNDEDVEDLLDSAAQLGAGL